jgi:hypothetical protein
MWARGDTRLYVCVASGCRRAGGTASSRSTICCTAASVYLSPIANSERLNVTGV